MHELVSGLFFFGLSLFVIWESLRVGLGSLTEPGSGFISLCVGVILCFLSLLLIREGRGVQPSRKPFPRQVILALILVILYSLALNTLGFIVATFLLVGLFFRLAEPRPWWALLGMSVLVTSLVYFIFGMLLHVYFPRGFLGF